MSSHSPKMSLPHRDTDELSRSSQAITALYECFFLRRYTELLAVPVLKGMKSEEDQSRLVQSWTETVVVRSAHGR